MRDEEEPLPVGNKEPPSCVVSRPVCSWLFKPIGNLSSGASLDCLEPVPMPGKHAAPFARLLCKVLCPPIRALVSCGWQTEG